ncbi:Photosynthetic NDH subunit of lumenal location 5, chloroplastic [Orchesella cincta]|uniref:Photosynthetic NDH subunit of lumenal location 5, chloroplastic n=1 Tax=Orchesella cincta TaxID=48709 RepID=A0A1D2NKU0_ORCCI|nr:Photosynthetic NDH subunit of lumenal location 5, chloroplastic [Orchesella cincta]
MNAKDDKLLEVPPKSMGGCNRRICDPSPAAYKLAEGKARLRSLDTRHPSHLIREREMVKHLIAVENAKPIVDTSAPDVPKMHYHNIFAQNLTTLFQSKIDRANARLLANLASIYSGHWKTGLDNKLISVGRCIRNRSYERAIKTMDQMHQNLKKFEALKEAAIASTSNSYMKPFYSRKQMSQWYSQQRKHMERISKFPNNVSHPKACSLLHRRVMEKSVDDPIQYAYLLIEVEDKRAANLVIELYADKCPFTVKNFQRLCTNTKSTGCDCRTYRCKKIDRLHCVQTVDGKFKKIYWVIGEHVDSTVEYTPMMINECSEISHSEAGLVTRPRGRAGGVFFITTDECRHLDEFCYVFGRVIGEGMDFLKRMESKNIEENGQPIINMHVTDCGIVNSADEVPPPMLLKDFISQVRFEIMPFMKRDPEKPDEWVGGKATFAEHLKLRAEEGRKKAETASKGGELAPAESKTNEGDE